MNNLRSFWENKYKNGYSTNQPWDSVVSFLYNNIDKWEDTKILEVGVGTGGNLLFASKLNCDVYGVDISREAINKTKELFELYDQKGKFIVNNFKVLPYNSNYFDFVIDRASLTHNKFEDQKLIIKEIYRVLKNKGLLHYNCYSEYHTSFVKAGSKNHFIENVKFGSLKNVGAIYFLAYEEIDELFNSNEWELEKVESKEIKDMSNGDRHSEWLVHAKKI